MTKPGDFKNWNPDAPRPDKRPAEIPVGYTAAAFCRDVYEDVPDGEPVYEQCTVGGQSLLISCNIDANRVQGWQKGEPKIDIYNARALHFLQAQKANTLPSMMEAGELELVEAWIWGKYEAATLPHEPDLEPVEEEPDEPKPQPQSVSPPSPPPKPQASKPLYQRLFGMVWPENNLGATKRRKRRKRGD